MTDNRTTEHLMAMLEERGVEYKAHGIIGGKAVTWHGSVCNWVALPNESGLAVAVYKDYLTPEQAIAATLGYELNPDGLPMGLTISDDGNLLNWRGENYVKQGTLGEQPAKSGADALSRRARDMARNIQGNLGRCLYRRKDVAEMEEVSETLMELADELNAELGSGTCENASELNTDGLAGYYFTCSECGLSICASMGIGEIELSSPRSFHWKADGEYEFERCPRCGKAVKR